MTLIITQHTHMNLMIKAYEEELQPFRKIHRLIDLFETIIKTHTALIIANYFSVKEVSEEVKALLAEGLKVPSLGIWQLFSKVIMDEMIIPFKLTLAEYNIMAEKLKEADRRVLEEYSSKTGDFIYFNTNFNDAKKDLKNIFIKSYEGFNKIFYVEDFHKYFYDWDKKVEKAIAVRNEYAHGSTPPDDRCIKDIEFLEPLLLEVLSANWLHNTSIVAFNDYNNWELINLDGSYTSLVNEELIKNVRNCNSALINYHPYLADKTGRVLDLFPIMSCKYFNSPECKQYSIVFFNDLKRRREVSLLNYPKSLHLRDKEMYKEFLNVINIEQWKHYVTSEFRDRILELTEIFKGRENEKKQIREFINIRRKGILCVFGSPGIGKSSLIAKIIREESFNKSEEEKEFHLIEYFVRRGTIHSRPDYMLDYLNRRIENLYKTEIPFGSSLEEKRVNLHLRLSAVSEKLSNKKIIVLIDGIDEGIEGNIKNYLVSETYNNILVVYTARQTRDTESFYLSIPFEYKSRFDIVGLGKEDIRAILYEVVSKYELKDSFINTICEKSQGNPLYVKMLCNKLETEDMSTYDGSALTGYIEDFYKEILFRLREEDELVSEGLYIIAAASDYISEKQLGEVLKINENKAARVISVLQEVLFENPQKENSYQIFHESFREFLFKYSSSSIAQARMKLIEYCRCWKDYLNYKDDVSLYTLKYYSAHLLDAGFYDELFKLAMNDEYVASQIELTGQYTSSFELCMDALKAASTKNESDKVLKIGTIIGRLHIKLSNSVNEIIIWLRSGEGSNVSGILERISSFTGREQFLLYINLIHYLIFSNYNNKKLKKDTLKGVLESFHKDWLSNFRDINWYEYLSFSYVIRLLKEIDLLEIDITMLLSVFSYKENKLDRHYSDELGFMEYKDYELFQLVMGESDKVYRERLVPEAAQQLFKIGYPKEILNLLKFLSDDYIKFDLMYQLIKHLIGKSQLEEALEILKDIKNDYYNSLSLIEIIKHLIRNGKIDDTIDILSTLSDYFSYDVLEGIFEELSRLKNIGSKLENSINSLYKAIQEKFGDTEVFNYLVEGLKNKNSLEYALTMEDNFLRQKALENFIYEVLENHNFEKAYTAAKYIQKASRENIISEIAIKCSECNELAMALELYKEIKGFDLKVKTAKEMCRNIHINNTDFALKVMEQISSVYSRYEIMGIISVQAAKEGNQRYSLEILQCIEDHDTRRDFSKVLSSVFLNSGNYIQSISLINSASKIMDKINYLTFSKYPENELLSEKILRLIDNNELEKALVLMNNLDDGLETILRKLIKTEGFDKLFLLLKSTKDTNRYDGFLTELKNQELWIRQNTLEKLYDDNKEVKNTLTVEINALMFALNGEIELSLMLINQIPNLYNINIIEKVIVKEAIKHEKINQVLAYGRETFGYVRGQFFVDLAIQISESGKIDLANAVMNEIISYSEKNQRYETILYSIIPILGHSIQKKDMDKVNKLINLAERNILADKSLYNKENYIKSIVDILRANGHDLLADRFLFKLADNFNDCDFILKQFNLESIYKDKLDKFLWYIENKASTAMSKDSFRSEIAIFLFEKGEYNRAKYFISRIGKEFIRALTMIKVSEIVLKKGDRKKALEILEKEINKDHLYMSVDNKMHILRNIFKILKNLKEENRIFEIINSLEDDEYKCIVIIRALLPVGSDMILDIIEYTSAENLYAGYKDEIYMAILKRAYEYNDNDLQIFIKLLPEIYHDRTLVGQWLYSLGVYLKYKNKGTGYEKALLNSINRIIDSVFLRDSQTIPGEGFNT